MKLFTLCIGLLAPSILASPTAQRENAYELRSAADGATLPMGAFSFHGPITPGGPNLTFEGTAQEIYEQIKVLNPEYDQWQFPEFKAKMAARGIHSQEEYENAQIHTRSLDPRGMSGNPAHILRLRDGQFDCGWGGWIIQWWWCIDGTSYLRRLGSGLCGAPAHSCSRVSCSNQCGMFLCSDTNREIRVECQHIADDMVRIAEECGESVFGDSAYRVKGRLRFSEHWTHLSHASC